MYIVEKSDSKVLDAKLPPLKTTNFDRFHRETIGARRFNNVLNYAM